MSWDSPAEQAVDDFKKNLDATVKGLSKIVVEKEYGTDNLRTDLFNDLQIDFLALLQMRNKYGNPRATY